MIEGEGKQMMKVMMMLVMIMVIGGQLLESTQSTDDGFAEYILESSDVLIKQKTDYLYILETPPPPSFSPQKMINYGIRVLECLQGRTQDFFTRGQ
jgi:hypothetical protein